MAMIMAEDSIFENRSPIWGRTQILPHDHRGIAVKFTKYVFVERLKDKYTSMDSVRLQNFKLVILLKIHNSR